MELERSQIQKVRLQNAPKQSDSKGTAFRIRPQTPKLNLLNQKKNKDKPAEKRKKHQPLEPIVQNKFPKENTKNMLKEINNDDILNGDERDDLSASTPKERETEPDYDDEEDEQNQSSLQQANEGMLFQNFQEKFLEIIDNEEVDNAVELNEIFLSQHLDVKMEDLATLQKIELRVDTSCHNLQVTGEILSSLEYLKMNDSIIKCFRDIGTSFRFVRVLWLARCELKEVQGIQALLQLEELYISYNDIDELFDIGFLEHLTTLDIEGNNISSLDQLYYLKRCQNLTDVNLKHNSVTKELAYYQRIQDNVPKIQSLDDEVVKEGFFEKKIDEAKKLNFAKSVQNQQQPINIKKEQDNQILAKLSTIATLLEVNQSEVQQGYEEALEQLQVEPEEEDMIIKRIKNFSKDQKASQSFENNLDEFEQKFQTSFSSSRPQSGKIVLRRTVTEGFGKQGPNDQFRSTNNSFYKAARSTALSSSEYSMRSIIKNMNNDNDQENFTSDLISNTDQVITGTPLSLLRRRQSSKKERGPAFPTNIGNGSVAPKDIYSLINEFHSEAVKLNRDDIRKKITENSLQNSSSKFDSIKNENIEKSNSQLSVLQQASQRKSLRTGIGSSNGPIKAERTVLKPQNISFIKKQQEKK